MLDALAAVARAVLYAGILSGAGAVFAAASLRRAAGTAAEFPRGLMVRGALVTIIAAASGALLLIFRLGGQFDEPTLSAVLLSGSGAAICLQLTGSCLLLATLGDDGTARAMLFADAVLLILSLAMYGHAAAAGGLQGAVALVHVSTAAWWVGSLWLLRSACAQPQQTVLAALLQRFSSIALLLVGALATAGLVLLLALVLPARDPLLSAYVRIIAVKLGIVALLLGLAGYNRYRLTPRILAGDRAAVTVLRRMIDAELLVIGTVLAATAVLTTYTSPPA